jgi:ABC-type molybdate transport system substrate-binding protein
LEQGFVITQRAADNDLASSFSAFLQSDSARDMFQNNGFDVPGEPAAEQ